MRLVFGFVVVVALLVGGLLVAPSFVDWGKYKAQGQAQIKSITGYDVQIDGDLSLAILPFPRVSASNVRVINPAVSSDPLATFDGLSASIALAPLLKKSLQVSEVSLVQPSLDLRFDAQGKGNWVSPEIEALLLKKPADEVSGDSAAPVVSFDRIRVEGGVVRFVDAAKGQDIAIESIDLSLKAESLQGPFAADGDVSVNGQEIAFDAKTGPVDMAAKSVGVSVAVLQGSYSADYKGVISFGDDVAAKGEVALSAKDLPGLADDVALKGFVSADPAQVVFKDTQLQIGPQAYDGTLTATLKPLKIVADFSGSDVLDLDALLPKAKAAQKPFDIADLAEILPATLAVPQDFDAQIAVSNGGVIYNKALIKDVKLSLNKTRKSFKINAQAANIPGNGPAVLDADLVFSERSVSKSGAQVYSDPKLSVTVQANTQNTGASVAAFVPGSIPVLSTARIGKFLIEGDIVPGRIRIRESVVNLDDLKLALSGSLKRQDNGRALIHANVTANMLDVDALVKAGGGGAKGGAAPSSPQDILAAMPFDTDFNVVLNKVVLNGQSIAGLKAGGALRRDAADVSVSAFGGSVSAKGSDLSNLAIAVKHPNMARGLKQFGIAVPAYASFSKPLDISATLSSEGKVSSLTGLKGSFAGTNVNGDLRYDGSGAVPRASGALKFGRLELVSAGGAKKGRVGSGEKWSSAPIDTAFLRAVNADFDVSADSILFEKWDMKAPALKVSLQNGTLNIQDLRAGLFGGQIGFQGTIAANGNNAPLALDTRANISDVNLGQLAFALSGTRQLEADGTVSFHANVKGAGASQKAIMGSLSGDASLTGQNIVMKGFDLQAITNAVANDNRESILAGVQSFGRGSTSFESLNGKYGIANGVVSIQSMAMEGVSASIVSTGSASLPQWMMDTKHMVSFNQTDKLDPFTFSIRGPIDKPVSTFANIGQDILRAQASKFIQDQLQDTLSGTGVGKKLQQFGILPGAQQPTDTQPAAGGNGAPAQQPQVDPTQKAIESVIKGLFE